jgi:hypothetical protein
MRVSSGFLDRLKLLSLSQAIKRPTGCFGNCD